MTDQDGNEWRTHDLYLAAFLSVMALPLRTERAGRRMIFIFTSTAQHDVHELRTKYFSGEAIVPAHAFTEKIKALKSLTNGDA